MGSVIAECSCLERLDQLERKCSDFACLAAALTRVMRAAVPIPAVASASLLQSVAVGGSVVGAVRPL